MNRLKLSSYGTYKFVDDEGGKRVPVSVLNVLAPGMYALLKGLEWVEYRDGREYPPYTFCPACEADDTREHYPRCPLSLILSTIESWDQEKFSLSWDDFERLQRVLKIVEGRDDE